MTSTEPTETAAETSRPLDAAWKGPGRTRIPWRNTVTTSSGSVDVIGTRRAAQGAGVVEPGVPAMARAYAAGSLTTLSAASRSCAKNTPPASPPLIKPAESEAPYSCVRWGAGSPTRTSTTGGVPGFDDAPTPAEMAVPLSSTAMRYLPGMASVMFV
eukprot:CAMPEP_0181383096 /NCGR_PEP_ID=MMETSP1106-20121128/21148_1 /TAXON_ID=81844 /ORGANISM="Mantoniella antarctica, Strain SL-175" /LENGTH=156 /DNA_ID=CAMNT_0023502675 /DNA_START=46 /DNA_END=516 /DNA_ORIENTATION=+